MIDKSCLNYDGDEDCNKCCVHGYISSCPVPCPDYKGFVPQINGKRIKFMLNGCDIAFVAEAPADITLEQLLKQCDKIKPDWCACGIRSLEPEDYCETEIIIGYNSIAKANENVSCRIVEGK